MRSRCHAWLRIKIILDTLTLLYDECHHCWWRLYNHKFNCTRNRRMLKSWAAKTQCYDLCCNTSFPLCLSLSVNTDLLYLPRELRSSSISAWCCSSKVSIDFGWILGDIPSPMLMSWNWNITLCKALSMRPWYWPGGLTTHHGLGLGPGLPQAHITARLQGRVRTVAKIILRINLRSGGVNTARGWAGGFISISTSYNMCKKCMWVYFSCSLIF